MRILAILSLLLSPFFVDSKHLRRPPTHRPTHHAPTLQPTTKPLVNPPTTKPTWAHTPEEYYYYAKLYYEKAAFDYNFFPHQGPAFYNAQQNEAKAKYLEARGKQEASELNGSFTLNWNDTLTNKKVDCSCRIIANQ